MSSFSEEGTSQDLNQLASWPEGLDALVVPGVPGRSDEPEAAAYAVYPSSTIDVIKLLRGGGVSVDYAPVDKPRAELALKAAEFWFPLIVFAHDVLADAGAHVLVEVIWDRVHGRKQADSILHLKVGRREADGTVDWFESHGRAGDVIDAFTHWSQLDDRA